MGFTLHSSEHIELKLNSVWQNEGTFDKAERSIVLICATGVLQIRSLQRILMIRFVLRVLQIHFC